MYILIDCVFCALLFLNIVQYVKYVYLGAKLHVIVHKIWLYDLKSLGNGHICEVSPIHG